MSRRPVEWIGLYAMSVLAALVVSALLVEITGGDWRPVLDALLDGSLRGPGRWGESMSVAAPMLIVALGTVVSARAGLVMLSTMKELPATLLLAPIGFDTLATEIWNAGDAGALAQSSLASLVLVALSGVLTWAVVLRRIDNY